MQEENFGFIHEELDIKILILYVLRRLPSEVEPDVLFDICASDGGVGYFPFSECLTALVKSGNVEENDFGYRITVKGSRNADTVESSLPYSVRSKVNRLLEPVAERLARDAMIQTNVLKTESGCVAELSVSDGVSDLISMKVLCADENQAKAMRKNFRRHAEDYYQKIVEMLSASDN